MITMKLKHITFALLVSVLASCDFMNCDESSDYAKEDIFASYSRVKKMVTHIYSFLPNGFGNIDGAMHDAATDDAVHVYKTSNIQRFVDGTWSANRTVDDVFSKYYEGIRAANLYLTESEGQTFEEWKYSDSYEKWMQNFENYLYEVRFLRAFFYFELVKRYQNVPLIEHVLTVAEANDVEPSSFETVANYVVGECTSIARELPIDYSGFADKESGRITRGAALALKARVLLYMASPLYSAHDTDKWEKAAAAASEIIGQASTLKYKLGGDYAALFSATNSAEAENILVRPIGETGGFEESNFPIGVKGGSTSTCPTENLVSAYEMTSGDTFDWNNEEMRKNPYADRDPRLEMTVAYNGMAWPKVSLEIWEGGLNALPINNATTTGYYLKKYVNKDISFESGAPVTKTHHCWVLFRYGEVLLNYAEAMVNAFDDPTYKGGKWTMSALDAVNLVRQRKGIEMPIFPATISSTDFLKRLKNERRVELAFEGHRFWDVRRWKDLGATKDIYGVSVKKEASVVKYTKQKMATRIVSDNMYFYPISNEEKFKNEKLQQNTGW